MSDRSKIVALTLVVSLIALGAAACNQATEVPAPTLEPQAAAPSTTEPTTEPTAVPTAAAALPVPLTAEQLTKLRALYYTLADGTTVSPAEAPAAGAPNLMVDTAGVRKGDLNGDGVEDYLVVLVNNTNPDAPELLLAPVIDEGGVYSSPGVITLGTDTDVTDVVYGDGTVEATLWEKTADGTYVIRQATFMLENGMWVQVETSESTPVPPPAPTDQPGPAAPSITMTLSQTTAKVGEQVDIYVHAFDNPAITAIDLYRDDEKVSSWTSSLPEGEPYVHHTFTWTPDNDGGYDLKAVARDMWGSEGWSATETLEVEGAE